MRGWAGIAITAATLTSAVYAFAPRPVPAFPASTLRMEQLLIADAQLAGERVVAVGERGTIMLSSDRGATWRRVPSPTEALLTAVYFADARHGWAVGHDQVILRTDDGGLAWERVFENRAAGSPLLDVWFADVDRGFAVGAYGAFYASSDGGRSWQARRILADDRHINAVHGSGDRVVLAGENGLIYVSGDRGKKFEAVAFPYRGSLFGALDLGKRGVVVYGLRGRLYRAADPVQGFARVPTSGEALLQGGAAVRDEIFVVGAAGTVLRSVDDGRSFAPASGADTRALGAVVLLDGHAPLLFGEARATPIKRRRESDRP